MGPEVRILVLGDLEVRRDGASVALGGPLPRTLLASLVVGRGRAVSADQLCEILWDQAPPPSALTSVQAYLSRLRRALGPGVLSSAASGYRLEEMAVQVDAETFRDAVLQTNGLAERPAAVVRLLAPALQLWRSASVLGVLGERDWAYRYGQELTELRQRARLRLATAELALGRPEEAAALTQSVLAEEPYHEEAARLLMLARYRGNRQDEALAVYERCRRSLADELGLEPSPTLASMQTAILSHDPALQTAAFRPGAAVRLLPPRNRAFTGRTEELTRLTELCRPGTAVTLAGLAGTGKSALALEFAHRSQGTAAWIPAEDRGSAVLALVELAARLGRGGGDEDDVLSDLWEILGQRDDWLLVYDNADSPDQITSLIPPELTGRVLVTSGNAAWTSLGAVVTLDPLSAAEGVTFVLTRVPHRDAHRAEELVDLLGNLPLALEQACSYVVQTGMGIADYLRLFDTRHEQLLLRGAPSDHRDTVTTTWQLLFYRVRLTSKLAGLLLELTAFLSPDGVPISLFEPLVAGADSGLELPDAFAALLRHSLVDRTDEVLRMHRLVQVVARDQLNEVEHDERAAQATRLVAAAAPAEESLPETWAAWAALAPQVHALVRSSAALPEAPPTLRALVIRCSRYYRGRGSLSAAHDLLDAAIEAASRRSRTTLDVALLRAELGDLLDAEGRLADARQELERVVSLMSALPGVPDLARARAWVQLAHVLNCGDEPAAALAHYERALPLLTTHATPAEVVRAELGFGYTRWAVDDFSGGEQCFRDALNLLRSLGWQEHPYFAEATSGLGMMLHEQGRLVQARDLQLDALALLHRLYPDRDHPTIAETLDKLCYVEVLLGKHSQAADHGGEAAAMLARLFGRDDPRLAMSLTNLGFAQLAGGRWEAARRNQERALAILTTAYGPAHRNTLLVADRLADVETLRRSEPVPARTEGAL